MQKHRLKLILEDGRRVYAARNGQIDTGSEDSLVRISSRLSEFAFAPDLTMFAPHSVFESQARDYVRVIDWAIEPDFLPLDEDGIIPGKG